MPIASTLEPLTDSQVAAYRRLPGDFGTMLQVCFNDGWNGCHAHMKEEIVKLDSRVAELEAAMERIIAGPYAGQFASAADVAAEALKR